MPLPLTSILIALSFTVAIAAPGPAKQRVIVLTDIENEPDDTQSMVRFLVYSNHWDVEALIATTSVHQREKTASAQHPAARHCLRKGPRQSGAARAGVPHGGVPALHHPRRTRRPRHERRRPRHGFPGLRAHHRSGRSRRSAARLGHCLGRPQLPRPSSLEGARDEVPRRPRPVRGQAPRLYDFRSGRQRTVAPKDFPEPLLHRQPRPSAPAAPTTTPPGAASAATTSTAASPAPTSPSWTIPGSTRTSAPKARSAHSTPSPSSSWKATRRASST